MRNVEINLCPVLFCLRR